MDFDKLDNALTGQNVTATELLAAVAVVLFGVALAWVVGRITKKRFGRPDHHTEQIAILSARVIRWLIVIVSVVWALNILGLEAGWLTVAVLLLLIVAALTAKPLAENLMSSVVLTARPSFGIGDEVGIDGFEGEVIEFSDRTTVLRLRDGRRVHIPNTEVLGSTVVVFTIDRARRSSVELGIREDTDIEVAERTILDAIADLDEIHHDPPPYVRATSLGDDFGLSIRFWHPSDIRSGNVAIDAVIRAIKTPLRDAGVRYAESMDIKLDTGD